MGRNQMGSSKNSDGFIDRSKVRILLCENDGRSSEEVFTLLCRCSYQVTSVRSPRQVIDALNAEGPEIDIILSEVDLPMAKGFKMLKYITRDKELRRIPVIMMSAQDEASVVVKCLRLGAADYLVKPLRTNELLNLWTHMWRRRRMLGLQEKNILNYDFDLVASDPSDTNTNSTTLFSDDTDDKSRKSANPDTCVSNQQEYETDVATIAAPIETPLVGLSVYQPDVHGTSHRWRGPMSSCPKKSELKIGESSAFFTYVKSSMLKIDSQGVVPVTVKAQQQLRVEKKLSTWGGRAVDSDTQGNANQEAQENHSQADEFPSGNSIPDSFSGFNPHMPYPYYISGLMNQVMMPSTAYQKNLQDLQNHAPNTPMLPQYNHIPNCPPHMSGIASFPYYPCPPPSQMPADHHPWPSHGSSSPSNGNMSKVDRREAALLKFRQKRKERCFDKKIRYVNRKRLAEKRARVRGQFARKIGGLNVDLNGQPALADYDDDDDEEDDDEED